MEVCGADGDSFLGWDGAPIKQCSDLVYILTLTNTSDLPMCYKINFRENHPDHQANLLWPRQGLLGSIGANEAAKIVAALAKRDPEAASDFEDETRRLQLQLWGEVDETKVKKGDYG